MIRRVVAWLHRYLEGFVCHACGRWFSHGRYWHKPGTLDDWCLDCKRKHGL